MQNREIHELKVALRELSDDVAVCAEERCDDEIRLWLTAASFRVWSANKLFSEAYISALSVLKEQEYTAAQVITALDCAGEDGRELNVPRFFRIIADKDKAAHTAKSREIVSSIGQFLASVALINGDFTLEEAEALRGVCALLSEHCDRLGIAGEAAWSPRPEMITPLNKGSYYIQPPAGNESCHNQPSEETEKFENTKNTSDPKTERRMPEITLKLNLRLGEDGVKAEDNSADGVTVKKPENNESAAEETLEDVLAELDSLVGLQKVKDDVHSLLNFIKICQLRSGRGMKIPTISYHLVFTGNPGTGKTTVARIVAKLYYLMGILPQGQLVETDRSGLVAGYLGQTAIKTQKVIREALGGVLFIDEAYALANDKEDSYGKEAIETLLKAMEDHRDELVVIVAGYDELMHKFIDSNPGLRSRFNKYFYFPDYDGDDLLLILKRFCEINGYVLTEDAEDYLRVRLNEMFENREEHFGNARTVRNIFEHAINCQANRLVSDDDITDSELAELTLDDITLAMEETV